MRNSLVLIFLRVYFLVFFLLGSVYLPLFGETTEVVLSNSMRCTKEELMAFFPRQIVESVLIEAKVSKEESAAIATELAKKDQQMAKIVEEKGQKVDAYSVQKNDRRELALKTYREALHEVFSEVLKSHGIKEESQIQSLLDKIQGDKNRLFIECVRKGPYKNQPAE